jgi:hypothetical protein
MRKSLALSLVGCMFCVLAGAATVVDSQTITSTEYNFTVRVPGKVETILQKTASMPSFQSLPELKGISGKVLGWSGSTPSNNNCYFKAPNRYSVFVFIPDTPTVFDKYSRLFKQPREPQTKNSTLVGRRPMAVAALRSGRKVEGTYNVIKTYMNCGEDYGWSAELRIIDGRNFITVSVDLDSKGPNMPEEIDHYIESFQLLQ